MLFFYKSQISLFFLSNRFFRVTGDYMGKILILLLKNDEFDKGCKILELLEQEQNSILGVPSFEALSLFVDKCIEKRAPSRGIVSIIKDRNLLVIYKFVLAMHSVLLR